jgi:hypothetical protein
MTEPAAPFTKDPSLPLPFPLRAVAIRCGTTTLRAFARIDHEPFFGRDDVTVRVLLADCNDPLVDVLLGPVVLDAWTFPRSAPPAFDRWRLALDLRTREIESGEQTTLIVTGLGRPAEDGRWWWQVGGEVLP